MLVFVGDTAYGAHVGDSRIYRMRDGNSEQLTEDHTLRNHMIREGKLEEGEPMNRQNAVTRAIGVAQTVDVDTFSVDLQPGDRFLLCSDGLTEYLEEARQLNELAGHEDLEAATRRCIDHANQSGGKDNVTVMMVDVADGDGVWDARQSSAKGRALRSLPHFANLGPDEFSRVVEAFQFQQVEKGAELVHPANAAEGLFLVVDGEVSLTDGGQDAGTVGGGEYFGERALLGAASAGLEAVAERTSRVAYLDRDGFETLLGADVELAAKISWNFLRGIMHRMRPMSESEYRRPGDALVDNRKTARMKAFDREDAEESSTELGADDSKPPPIPGGRPGGPKRAIPRPGGDADEGDETADMEQENSKPFDGISGAATVSSRGSQKKGKKNGRSSKSKSKRRGGGRKNRETIPMNSEDDSRNQD